MFRLSAHFTLEEFIRSKTAQTKGIKNEPDALQIERMRWFCVFLLEPVRRQFGPIYITSGYRCSELNGAVDGARNSFHQYRGEDAAADFQIRVAPLREVVNWILLSSLVFDKVILERGREERHEFDDAIHLQVNTNPRRLAFLGPTHGAGSYVPLKLDGFSDVENES